MSASATYALATPSAVECSWPRSTWIAILATLSLATFLIHGYHPFADDGGLYVAGIEHLHFSLFAPAVAALIRITQLSLPSTLLLLDLLSITLAFFAAHQLLQRCALTPPAQLAALSLLAAFWTLPIAGTSLSLMDPYLTARSFSTPLSLLAIAFALDRWSPSRQRALPTSAIFTLASLCVAASLHPLMAAYAFAFVLVLRLTRHYTARLAYAALLVAACTLAAALTMFAPAESAPVIAAQLSRDYWFLSRWQWFEIIGLLAPLAIFLLLLQRNRRSARSNDSIASLCQASLITASIAFVVALTFAHRDASTHLVARLQPLRSFLLPYAIMVLLLGATVTQSALNTAARTSSITLRKTLTLLPALGLVSLAAIFFAVQRQSFPASPHIELPSTRSSSPWVNAFLWARTNTPPDALFALDPKYVNESGEDAQTFRAIALRSTLPDFSKDGGEAAITPSLATLWQQGATAQLNLSTESDNLRDAHLFPLNVTWMVLHSTAITTHPCPYNNGTLKVCSLPHRASSTNMSQK